MKTQFSFSQRGFTMVEIMVVIAIISSLFAMMSQIDFRPQQNLTNAERIANKIQSIFHTSNVSVMMGRMDQNSVAATGATIELFASWAWHRVDWVLTDTLSGTFQAPFFDGDTKYEIQTIKGCEGGTTNSGYTNSVIVDISRDGTVFTGTTDQPLFAQANILEIQVRYINMSKKIIFDRRTGRIEIRRQWEDLCK